MTKSQLFSKCQVFTWTGLLTFEWPKSIRSSDKTMRINFIEDCWISRGHSSIMTGSSKYVK